MAGCSTRWASMPAIRARETRMAIQDINRTCSRKLNFTLACQAGAAGLPRDGELEADRVDAGYADVHVRAHRPHRALSGRARPPALAVRAATSAAVSRAGPVACAGGQRCPPAGFCSASSPSQSWLTSHSPLPPSATFGPGPVQGQRIGDPAAVSHLAHDLLPRVPDVHGSIAAGVRRTVLAASSLTASTRSETRDVVETGLLGRAGDETADRTQSSR